MPALYAGIDAGTSGVRLCLINDEAELVYEDNVPLPPGQRQDGRHEQDPASWWSALTTLLKSIPGQYAEQLRALSIDATSGTVLLADKQGKPVSPALMYNDARSTEEAIQIRHIAPDTSGAHGASSSLAKLIWLQKNCDISNVAYALHQADWLLGKLSGQYGISDENNCLKLGYDPVTRNWPDWISKLGIDTRWLPGVHEPGTVITRLSEPLTETLCLPAEVQLCTGTTDSIAAFLATGAAKTGEAVTSLGSTLAIKILGEQPLFDPRSGIYSHRLWDQWLIGGASNSGGAVLKHFFSNEQINTLSQCLDPDHPTGLDYYPLISPGERFPISDPGLEPRLTPRPADDCQFFQGLLEGISRIEHQAYTRLHALGAPQPTSIRTVGGGSSNAAWTQMRARITGVKMIKPKQREAAYGAALLARRGIMRRS